MPIREPASSTTGTALIPCRTSVFATSRSDVPGATVTLRNEATKLSFTTETTSSGQYVFDSVQVGVYTVEVEKQGFKKFVAT